MELFFFYYIWMILCIIFLLIIRFNMYKKREVYDRETRKYSHQKGERYRFPLISYILGFIAAFVPVCNIVFFIASVVFIGIGVSDDEITFSGWLFKEI